MIHSGSRGLGHQVCTDHLRVMGEASRKYGITLPDRQLACAPIASPEGRHNIAKFETFTIDGTPRTLCVHRKGATRAYPPGHPGTPSAYRQVGQPVLIP